MQELVFFKGYLSLGDEIYARFNDPQGGSDITLTHEECQERLGNLRDNNLSYEETERALMGWPKNAD